MLGVSDSHPLNHWKTGLPSTYANKRNAMPRPSSVKPIRPEPSDTWEHCLTVGCDGYAVTRRGTRQPCRECVKRAERIAAMAKRLRKASDPAFGNVHEFRFAEFAR